MEMKKYGVLVVDDSAFMRKLICDIIEASPLFYEAGRARNGKDALEKVKRLKPDIVTLDIEMPELNGLETLKILMEEMPLPVVMLSNGTASTLEAFELGAVDFVVKSELLKENNEAEVEDFYKRLEAATKVDPKILTKQIEKSPTLPKQKQTISYTNKNIDLIVIGSSTGGPAALQTIITKLPATMPIPIVVVQHMPVGFTKFLAERFDRFCRIKVKEAEQDEVLKGGTVYIAPAGKQTLLRKNAAGQYVVEQRTTSPVKTLFKPSVDVTLLSVAEYAKDKILAVILTGMGSDGLEGCRAIKKHSGTVIAESEETCVVYGMPKAVFNAGLVDKQLPLPLIAEEILFFAQKGKNS